jgi:SAM-dependent methyltransferase
MAVPQTDVSASRANARIRVVSSASRPPSLPQALAIKLEGLLWRRRAEHWDEEGSIGLAPVVAAVLDSSSPHPEMVAVDLGCGSGQVTLPLARRCLHVVAVDLSEDAIALLKSRAERQGIGNVHALAQPIETFELAPQSVELVVSNYALHHLRDREKADLVRRSFAWLCPGGRLVIGDVMLGRGSSSEDREVIASKVRALAKRGPAGWWRIFKNAWRFTLRLQEKPLPASAWETLVRKSGFGEVRVSRVRAEAWILSARKPAPEFGAVSPTRPGPVTVPFT